MSNYVYQLKDLDGEGERREVKDDQIIHKVDWGKDFSAFRKQ